MQGGGSMAATLDLRLPATREAAGKARRAVERLAGELDPEVLADVRLLVSELVTNSVRHAGLGQGDSVRLRAEAANARVRVDVTDSGPGFDPSAALSKVAGWGIYLVDQLADRWGVAREGGTRVWFEIEAARSGLLSGQRSRRAKAMRAAAPTRPR